MGGSDTARLIAWDSCVFIGWFDEEIDKPLDDMRAILQDVAAGRCRMLVSSIVRAEVLDKDGFSSAGTDFCEFCKRSNVIRASADFRVADKAATFREATRWAMAEGDINAAIKAPDALIVATAVIYKADVLHTFDPTLLSLSGSSLIDGLKTSTPNEGGFTLIG